MQWKRGQSAKFKKGIKCQAQPRIISQALLLLGTVQSEDSQLHGLISHLDLASYPPSFPLLPRIPKDASGLC